MAHFMTIKIDVFLNAGKLLSTLAAGVKKKQMPEIELRCRMDYFCLHI